MPHTRLHPLNKITIVGQDKQKYDRDEDNNPEVFELDVNPIPQGTIKIICECSICSICYDNIVNYSGQINSIDRLFESCDNPLTVFIHHNKAINDIELINKLLYLGIKTDEFYQLLVEYDKYILPTTNEINFKYHGLHVYDDTFCLSNVSDCTVKIIVSPPVTGKTTITEYAKEHFGILVVNDIDDAYNFRNLFNQVGEINSNFQRLKNLYVQQYIYEKELNLSMNDLYFLVHNQHDVENIKQIFQYVSVDVVMFPKEYYIEKSQLPDDEFNTAWRAKITLQYYDELKHYGLEIKSLTIVQNHSEYNLSIFKGTNAFTDRYKYENENQTKYLNLMSRRSQTFYSIKRANLIELLYTDISREQLQNIFRELYPPNYHELFIRTRINYKNIINIFLKLKNVNLSNIMLKSPGQGQHFIANVLMILLAIPSIVNLLNFYANQGYFGNGVKQCVEIMKDIHAIVRRSASIPISLRAYYNGNYNNLLYFDQIVGRFFGYKISLDKTIPNRRQVNPHTAPITDNIWSENKFDELIYEEIDSLTGCLNNLNLRKEINEMTFSKWRSKFISLGAPGTIGEGKQQLKHLESTVGANKRIWLGEIEDEFILDLPQSDPVTYITCTLKLELGKLRQLLPGPIKHWLAENVILSCVEKTLLQYRNEVVLEKTKPNLLGKFKRRLYNSTMLSNFFNVGIDYADFNITHTHKHMQYMYKSIAKQMRKNVKEGDFKGVNFNGFVVEMCDFVIKCLDHLFARAEGGDGLYFHILRGLWTGWRSTSFFNILFNYIYLKITNSIASQIVGYPLVKEFESMGDDVNAQSLNKRDSIKIMILIKCQDHDVNDLKQLLGKRIEFLRCMYENGKVRGSLVRALCGFVSSDTQAPVYNDSLSTMQGTNEAINLLIRRGANLCNMEALREILAIDATSNPFGDTYVYLNDKRWLFISQDHHGFGLNRYAQPSNLLRDSALEKFVEVEYVEPVELYGVEGAKYTAMKHLIHHVNTKFNKVGLSLDSFILENQVKKQVYKELRETQISQRFIDSQEMILKIMNCNNNRLAHKIKSTLVSPTLYKTVEFHLMNIENSTAEQASKFDIVDIESTIESIFNLVLGEASIAPAIIHTIKDENGRRLKPIKIIERLNAINPEIQPKLDKLTRYYGSNYIDLYLEKRTHLVHDVGGILPPEIIQYLIYVHMHMIGNLQPMSLKDIDNRLYAINLAFIKIYFDNNLNNKYML